MTAPGDSGWIVFETLLLFEEWNRSASTQVGVANYSSPLARMTPDDGSVVGKFRLSDQVWSGESHTGDEVLAMGYRPLPPADPTPPED